MNKENLNKLYIQIEDIQEKLEKLKDTIIDLQAKDRYQRVKDLPGVIGVFDGENIITEDNKKIKVTENYAVKSRIVYGDTLKLIEEDGKKIFKQLIKLPRLKVFAVVSKKEGNYYALTEYGDHKISPVAVEYNGLSVGEEIQVRLPENNPNAPFATFDKKLQDLSDSNKSNQNKEGIKITQKKDNSINENYNQVVKQDINNNDNDDDFRVKPTSIAGEYNNAYLSSDKTIHEDNNTNTINNDIKNNKDLISTDDLKKNKDNKDDYDIKDSIILLKDSQSQQKDIILNNEFNNGNITISSNNADIASRFISTDHETNDINDLNKDDKVLKPLVEEQDKYYANSNNREVNIIRDDEYNKDKQDDNKSHNNTSDIKDDSNNNNQSNSTDENNDKNINKTNIISDQDSQDNNNNLNNITDVNNHDDNNNNSSIDSGKKDIDPNKNSDNTIDKKGKNNEKKKNSSFEFLDDDLV